MRKNSEIISQLAKIQKTGKSFRHLRAKRGQHETKLLFVCLFTLQIYILKTSRGHDDSESAHCHAHGHFVQHRFNSTRLTMSVPFSCLYFFFFFYPPQRFLSHLTRRRGGRSRSCTSFRWSSAGGSVSVNPSVTFNTALCCSHQ